MPLHAVQQVTGPRLPDALDDRRRFATRVLLPRTICPAEALTDLAVNVHEIVPSLWLTLHGYPLSPLFEEEFDTGLSALIA
jgi:hypothetical protein